MTGATATMPAGRGEGSSETAAAPQLFVALESHRPTAWPSRHLLGGLGSVEIGRGAARDVERSAQRLALALADPQVSTLHARLFRLAGDRFILEDAGSKNGTLLNGSPVRRAALADGDVIEVGRTLLLYRAGAAPLRPERADLDGSELAPPAPGLETFLAGLGGLFAALARAAASDIPILLRGDTGTGKEIVARAAHALSQRPGPFVAVNCGALPGTLVESALFGHRRGAFSGAIEDRPGLVRSAERGTLFLDEIGELAPAAQVALLRVLQEHEVVPVGETRPLKVDVRLISATHRPIDAIVEAGSFRADLLGRISGLTVRLPGLAARREDLGLLVRALLRRAGHDDVTLAAPAARALFRHDWPRNIRELEKTLATAVVLADGELGLEHLSETLRPARAQPAPPRADDLGPEDRRLRDELVALLDQHRGNVSAVARAMGKGRMQVHRWLKRFSLQLERFRP
jgi:sigma54-dependent transcription regulator